MKFTYSLSLAVSNLARSKLRTWLTVTGIIIGVAAVVLILSLGNALQANVSASLSGLGANLITVTPGFSRASSFGFGGGGGRGTATLQQNLTTSDSQAISTVPNINATTGFVSGRVVLSYRAQNTTASLKGIDAQTWYLFTSDTIASGRMLTVGDSNSVVLGYNIANQYFTQIITPNAIVTINNQPYRVVGILAQSGSFGGDDSTIIMPITQARTVLGLLPTQYTSIEGYVEDLSQLNATETALTNRLMNERHDTPNTIDFSVSASETIQQNISSVTSSLTLFLGLIAAVSLLVGAIGIANTMFMTVLERTRQIGIFKALGATSWEISRLFLVESSLLGLAGGALGVGVSILITGIISSAGIAIQLGFGGGGRGGGGIGIVVTPDLIIMALVFSTIIGALAGYFPARQAAKLKPVDALRYE